MFGLLKKLFSAQSNDVISALRQGGTIIDVRTPAEFSGGSADKAINIPHTAIAESAKQLAKLQSPLVVCCASGMRSGIALQELKRLGYVDAVNGKTWGQVQQVVTQLASENS